MTATKEIQNESTTESTEVLPPEASMAGDNTIYVGCDFIQSRQNYGLCLYTIKAEEEGRLEGFQDCRRPIGNKTCPALKMREEERQAGRALYYKKREIKAVVTKTKEDIDPVSFAGGKVDKNSLSYKRGWNSVGGNKASDIPDSAFPKATRVKPKSKPKTKDALERGMDAAGTMTDVINDAAQSVSTPSITRLQKAPKAPVKQPKAVAEPKVPQKDDDAEREERRRKARLAAQRMRGE